MRPLFLLLGLIGFVSAYDLVRDYSGPTFFDDWDFYGSWDNLTLGDVWWLNREDAFSQRLVSTTPTGTSILKIDNSAFVPFNTKRNSVRITSKHAYGVGSLWVIDLLHIPYGCSVWPAFWTKGPVWPDNGEIDIMEGINGMQTNQYALHTLPGCVHSPSPQKGTTREVDCSVPSGCTVMEASGNSYGPGFAVAGGGVYATQFDVTGIYIWFFPRSSIPSSLLQSSNSPSLSLSDWGPPSASYPSKSCNIPQFFSPQNLVLDITLCGIWAGDPVNYLPTCGNSGGGSTSNQGGQPGQGGPTQCYLDNVVGQGSPKYDNAYFEINHVRAYTTGGAVPSPTVPISSGRQFKNGAVRVRVGLGLFGRGLILVLLFVVARVFS
ncbi:hypothetical protein E1B28_000465 [Marasmius oreades]|uniref:GH16 domain-containing protein n=1 Tax=Marasmius oreades TaxID=181124 RepID=A0A9P7V1B0_9AGAR|nr:uncharacterized protein E1B28_000465 [Marasmius oreades]KAG7098526.1 hypothetical protein E1B28_000465 [Marasmius oreades]